MASEREETLPSGIRVSYWNPVFGERRWEASHPDCCGVAVGFSRDEAIKNAALGCTHCDAKPIKNPMAPRPNR